MLLQRWLHKVGVGAPWDPAWGPWGLRGTGLKPEQCQAGDGSQQKHLPPLGDTGRPSSPCWEPLGNYAHSFKVHFLHASAALSPEGDPGRDGGGEIRLASGSDPQQVGQSF